ncbi:glycosyltransferase family 4 protein [Streptomyces sp. NPDC001073]
MHILLVSPLYYPSVGGAETHTRSIARALAVEHTVTVLADAGHRNLPRIEISDGVRVLRTVGAALVPPGYRDVVHWEHSLFGLLAQLEELIDELPCPPDMIHAQCQIAFLLGCILKERFQCPLIATPHETTPESDGLGDARSRFFYTLPQIDLFVAGSNVFANQITSLGHPGTPVEVIESGVFLPEIPNRQRIWSRGTLSLLSIGRFKQRKNQLSLLDALALLRDRGVEAHCTFAGSCDAGSVAYRDELVRRARDFPGTVVVHEDLPDAEVRSLISNADMVVQPALAEGLGLVAVEALGMGTPILATPTDGAREVLANYPSLMTRGFAAKDLADAIEDILSRPARFQSEVVRATRSVRKRFNARANAVRLLNVYEKVIEEHRARS